MSILRLAPSEGRLFISSCSCSLYSDTRCISFCLFNLNGRVAWFVNEIQRTNNSSNCLENVHSWLSTMHANNPNSAILAITISDVRIFPRYELLFSFTLE